MKKDITFYKAEDVGVAIVPESDTNSTEWMAYLLNTSANMLEGVIVSSSGYGIMDQKEIKTSTLRQFFERVEPGQALKIEMVDEKVFGLNNEFWISFWLHGQMYERKIVFLPGSITEDYFTQIPILNKRGVLIL
jgi:hypothetical protein